MLPCQGGGASRKSRNMRHDVMTITTPPQPERMDVPGALGRLGGDRQLLHELYGAFRLDAPKRLAMLQQSFQDQAPRQVRKHAHAIKGAAAIIGALRCRELAEGLERAADAAPWESLLDQGVRLEAETLAVLAWLDGVCAGNHLHAAEGCP